MNAHLALSPLLPLPVLIAAGVLAFVLVALGFWARRPGMVWRALGLALLIAALLDPTLVEEDRKPLKDVVAVVLDHSGSQSLGERTAQTEAARAEIEHRLAELGNIEARFVEAGQDTGTETAGADGTRLFASLNAALADVPPERLGAVLMVTDGLVDDIPASAAALGFKAPLHALITGHRGERDRRVELVEAPRFGLVGKDLTLRVRVLDTLPDGGPIPLVVRRDGVDVLRLNGRPGQVLSVPVRIEHGGPNVIELDIPALPDELTAINNRAVVTVEGVRDKLKVLLVSGEPHAGERTWRNLLKSDPNVDLVHFTILRPPEKQDGTPINELSLIAFPTADLFGRKISEFDLIVFDRYSNQSILPPVYFQNIVRYVREGGALLLAVGPDFATPEGLSTSALGLIAPVVPTGQELEQAYRPQISDAGAKHPVTRDLAGGAHTPPAWGRWFEQVGAQAVRGTTVMTGANTLPLLVLAREAKGRVAMLLSDQMWLWARGFEGGGPHVDLLRRLGHWLMKEPELEEEALRATARGRTLTITRQTLEPSAKPVTLTAPSGATQSVALTLAAPGLWQAKVTAPELGLTQVSDGALRALVNIGPENPREFQEVVSTPARLAPLAAATGGTVRRLNHTDSPDTPIELPRFVAMGDSSTYGARDFIGIHRTGASVVTGVGSLPVALGFAGLFALLGSVLAGWWADARVRRPKPAGKQT